MVRYWTGKGYGRIGMVGHFHGGDRGMSQRVLGEEWQWVGDQIARGGRGRARNRKEEFVIGRHDTAASGLFLYRVGRS